MDVRLPDGRVIRNVPEGTSKKDLAKKLIDNNVIDDDMLTQLDPRLAMERGMSAGERFLVGTGRGFMDVAQGAKQLGLEVGEFLNIVDPSTVKRYNEQTQEELDFYNQGELGFAGGAGRVTGNIAATAAPGGVVAKGASAVPALAKLGQALSASRVGRAAMGAGAGAAGGSTVFVEEGDSRLTNTMVGAGAGAVLPTVAGAISRGLQKIPRKLGIVATRSARRKAALESLRGKVPKGDELSIADDIADGLTPEQALAKYEIERIGATPTRGRISGDPGDLGIEVRLGRAQDNISDDIARLQGVQQQNKKTILDYAQSKVEAFGPSGQSGARARSALSGAKQSVKENVVDPAYEKAGSKLAAWGDDVVVPTNNLKGAIDEFADDFTLNELAPLKSALNSFDLESLTAAQAERLRRRLDRATVTKEGVRAKAALMRALESDVKDKFGEDLFAEARDLSYKEYFQKYVNPARVRAVIEGDIAPEDLSRKVLSSFNVDETTQFFKVLDEVDPETANAVRGSIMNDIVSKLRSGAIDAEGVPEINSAQFFRNINNLKGEQINAIFGDGAYKSLQDLSRSVQRLISVDRRAAGPNTANDLANRVQDAGFALLTKFPLLGSIMLSMGRAVRNTGKDIQNSRLARRALNIALLKNENVMGDIMNQSVSFGGSAAIGQQAASNKEAPVEKTREFIGGFSQ